MGAAVVVVPPPVVVVPPDVVVVEPDVVEVVEVVVVTHERLARWLIVVGQMLELRVRRDVKFSFACR